MLNQCSFFSHKIKKAGFAGATLVSALPSVYNAALLPYKFNNDLRLAIPGGTLAGLTSLICNAALNRAAIESFVSPPRNLLDFFEKFIAYGFGILTMAPFTSTAYKDLQKLRLPTYLNIGITVIPSLFGAIIYTAPIHRRFDEGLFKLTGKKSYYRLLNKLARKLGHIDKAEFIEHYTKSLQEAIPDLVDSSDLDSLNQQFNNLRPASQTEVLFILAGRCGVHFKQKQHNILFSFVKLLLELIPVLITAAAAFFPAFEAAEVLTHALVIQYGCGFISASTRLLLFKRSVNKAIHKFTSLPNMARKMFDKYSYGGYLILSLMLSMSYLAGFFSSASYGNVVISDANKHRFGEAVYVLLPIALAVITLLNGTPVYEWVTNLFTHAIDQLANKQINFITAHSNRLLHTCTSRELKQAHDDCLINNPEQLVEIPLSTQEQADYGSLDTVRISPS